MEDMSLYEGVVDMLDALKDGGYKLGIATMRHGRITRGISGGMGIAHLFEVTVGVDETEKTKPEPDHVLTACRLLGVEPEEVIMVGDTKFDILSGKGAGCTAIGVTWGSGTKEGLEKAANEKPDLILLDTNMPVMGGHEMLERLQEQSELKDIPVIMVTVVCEPQDIATASSYGIVDYVTKPFDFTDLMEKIANALKNKKVGQLAKANS